MVIIALIIGIIGDIVGETPTPDETPAPAELIYKQFYVLEWLATEGPFFCTSAQSLQSLGPTMVWLMTSGYIEFVPQDDPRIAYGRPALMLIQITEAGRQAVKAHAHMDLDEESVDPFKPKDKI